MEMSAQPYEPKKITKEMSSFQDYSTCSSNTVGFEKKAWESIIILLGSWEVAKFSILRTDQNKYNCINS